MNDLTLLKTSKIIAFGFLMLASVSTAQNVTSSGLCQMVCSTSSGICQLGCTLTTNASTTGCETTTSSKTTTSHKSTTSPKTTTSHKTTTSPKTTTSHKTTTSPKTTTSHKTTTSPITTTSYITTTSPTTEVGRKKREDEDSEPSTEDKIVSSFSDERTLSGFCSRMCPCSTADKEFESGQNEPVFISLFPRTSSDMDGGSQLIITGQFFDDSLVGVFFDGTRWGLEILYSNVLFRTSTSLVVRIPAVTDTRYFNKPLDLVVVDLNKPSYTTNLVFTYMENLSTKLNSEDHSLHLTVRLGVINGILLMIVSSLIVVVICQNRQKPSVSNFDTSSGKFLQIL